LRRARPESVRRPAIDPHAAFHARAQRDRRKLVRLAGQVERAASRRQMAAVLALIEGVAHGLAGASGVFGFTALGEHAAKLERLLERWRTLPLSGLSHRQLAAFRRRLQPLLDGLALVEPPPGPSIRSYRETL
jgi:HPt (histidine-containing phosphotransfer) domain-containing protein